MSYSIEEYRRIRDKYDNGKYASTEHDLQKSCVRWFRYTHRDHAKLLLAIPNGARRTKFERTQALEEGLVAGTPDLLLAIARHDYHGLWIEMKNGKAGRVSDKQTEMIQLLLQQGYDCRIVRTFEEFVQIVEDYLK